MRRVVRFLTYPILFLWVACVASGDDAALETRMEAGERIYNQTCLACHQPNGQGLPGIYPPLAQSDYLMTDLDRAIRILIEGQEGEIVVNGKTYNQVMTPQYLSDEQIANVLTYIMNTWGNTSDPVTEQRVSDVRDAL